ncbi:hypothetical protein [Sphingomonas sp. LaA6.9]|uniref:hypothetical protein n=1 Tax=Sphingomonas sp. LaA6.9 TaxID=2919914 RepID=UPI001F503737|nr:hypothetical protein [Sphingomonas sp. LaA6.9]MCJ8158818.1 hypothetical protein [Sphingomonas sp. LaA6.9]
MAKLPGTPQYLDAKRLANGGYAYYWNPSPALRRAGWKGQKLGKDLSAAIKAAEKLNEQIESWKLGGAKPKKVKAHHNQRTMCALIDAYKKARFKPVKEGGLADSTQREYASKFRTLMRWTARDGREGALSILAIDRKAVLALRDALMTPIKDGERAGEVRHHMAHATLRVLRTLLDWAKKEEWIAENPAVAFELSQPAPRDQIWWPVTRDAMEAQAEKEGAPSLALTIALAPFLSQRQGDMLKFQLRQYAEIPAFKMDKEVFEALAGMNDAGNVMGISLRQGKTSRWVEVPIVGKLRDRVEAEIAKRKQAGVTTLFIDDRNSLPWDRKNGQTYFQRRFLEVKRAAIAVRPDIAAELDELEFRDYRRTGVVMLGEMGIADHLIAAITGHTLDETKEILETYMPRTTGMAARAIALSQARSAKAEEKKEKQG